MADIAELGFQIDSSPVTKTKEELDKLATSADNVQKSARNLAQYGFGQTMQTQAQMLGTAGRGMTTAVQQVEQQVRGSASGMDVLYAAINRVVGVTGGMAQGVGTAATRFAEMSTAAQQASMQGGVLKSVFEEIGVSVGAVIGVVTGLAAAFAASLSFKSFLDNTIEAEQVTTKLNTALTSTQGAAGQTMESLNALAEEMSKSTTFSSDNVKAAEGMLLMYTRISGETFPTAMKAAADLAAKMGTDLPNATRMLGRALQEPATSMDSLRRMGVVLSQTQQDQIKHFVALNDAAGAQKVILDAVNKAAGGTAEAVRNTLGGAITVLKNTWNDLFSLGGKPVDALRTAIDGLTIAISNQAFRDFIQTIGNLLFSSMTRTVGMVTSMAEAISSLVNHMSTLAPIVATVAVALAAAFAPAIIDAALTLAGAVVTMAVSFSLLLGPIGLIAGALGVIAVLAAVFRDKIKATIGVDVGQIFKDLFNAIVNGFSVAILGMGIIWNGLPAMLDSAMVQFQNMLIDRWNDIKLMWFNAVQYLGTSFASLNATLSGWFETFKGYIAKLVLTAQTMIPEWLKKFFGMGNESGAAGAAVGGGVGAAGGAIPPPPPQISAPLAPTPTPHITDNSAAAVAATNKAMEDLQKQFAGNDAAGKFINMISNAFKGLGGAATGATPPTKNLNDQLDRMRNPGGAGKEDPFQKIITGAQEYIAKQNALAQSFGLTGVAALALTHEQDLLNKAVQAHITLSDEQRAKIHAVAMEMAVAQQAAITAKFIKTADLDADKFIADQKLQAAAVFQSAQAADEARIAQDLLNKARQEGADLTNPALIASIQRISQAEAEAAQHTRDMKEWGDLAKTTFTSFLGDLNQGLQQGKTFWDALGQAGINALNNISNKLMQMASQKLMEAAFGGGSSSSGGGGGGFFGSILGGIGSLLGGSSSSTAPTAFDSVFTAVEGSPFMFASGGSYPANQPRIVGEKGPELDIPKTAGTVYNAKQLQDMISGSNNDNAPITIQQTVHFGSDVTPQTMARWAEVVKQQSIQGAIAGVANSRSRGGQMKQVFKK